MDGKKRLDEYHWECLLLNDVIEDGLCCEINQVNRHYLKKEAVPEVDDWDKAAKTCSSCKYHE